MNPKIKELQDQIATIKDEIKKESKIAFDRESCELFTKHPEMTSFRLKAYTPYFNDGDSCTYSVHLDEPYIKEQDSYEFKTETWDGKPREGNANLWAAYQDVKDFLRQFDTEFY